MEAGAWTEEPVRPNFPSIESVHNQPLRGVEPLHSNEQAASVRIRAKDADSGRSISEYWVSPGWVFDGGQHPVWHPYQRLNANATMLVPVAKRSGRAFVLVEADGYVPQSVEVDGRFGETIDVSLSRGQGLRGVVLTPNGEPAVWGSGAHDQTLAKQRSTRVGFLKEGAFRWDTLQLHEHQLADLDGHFEFAPREVMRPIVIAHASGYLEVKEPDLNAPLELRLQSWSGFEGVIKELLDPELRLGVHRGATLSTEEPATSLFQKVLRKVGLENSRKIPSFWDFVTVEPTVERGENGRFKVDLVPPGRWNLSLMRFVKSKNIPGASEGRSVARTQAELAPGERASVTLRPFSEGAGSR